MSANGISTLPTREDRQVAKLDLAAINNANTDRRSIYDLNELPTKYSGNTIVYNAHPDGLLEGRPWVDITRIGLQLYLDPATSASYSGSGTVINDLSENASVGTLINGVGYVNSALTFDGINQYIDMNATVTSNDFCIVAWFKCDPDVSNFRMIASKETPAGTPWNYRLYIDQTTGKIVGDIADSSTIANIVTASGYNDNQWHMVAFIRNTNTNQLLLYVDGALNNQVTDTTGTITNSQEVWFGRSAFTAQTPTGSYPYKGSLGELMIYNRVLTDTEISVVYRSTRSRYSV